MIVHAQTIITTLLLEIDADGNTLKKIPVQTTLNALTEAEFIEAFRLLKAKRDEVANADRSQSN